MSISSTRRACRRAALPPLAAMGAALVLTACTIAPGAAPPATGGAPAPTASGSPAGAAGAARVADETRFVDSVLALMTVSEKLGQLNQLSGVGEPTGPGGAPAGIERIRRGEVGSLLNVIGADTTRALQRIAVEQSRLRIPLLFALDVIHGYRTIFPVPLGEASSWDTALVRQAARVAAREASAAGIDWTFAPMVDIARDPRWGRIVEGSGEDPYLGSAMAAARVHGFQGASGLGAADAIAATAKHFAAYGAAEGGRDYNVADISDRTLRDVYLPPFHAAACAGAATFMASFNEIGGVPSHANRWLNTTLLRGDWGFDGLVVSDWTGVGELLAHGIAADTAEAARAALDAGVDVDMVSEVYLHGAPRLLADRRLPMATLDEAVRRVLRLKYRLGLFANPYLRHDAARERGAMLAPASRTLARDVARRSLVLLENRGGVLPLGRELRTLAVIGPLAADSGAMLGNWAGRGEARDAITPLDAIRRAVSARTTVLHARGAEVHGTDSSGLAAAVDVASRADAIVLVIGETPDMSAEASSRAFLDLPGGQQRLVDAVAARGKPVVAVLFSGRPLALTALRDRVPAILEVWFPGIEAGPAIADVLFGDVNPSGKLPVSVPRAVGQVPIYYARRNTGRPPAANEKYTSKYLDLPWTPLYPFGHGLSYTSFAYGTPRLSTLSMSAGDTLHVDVDVRNAGARDGEEVVQLYVRDEVGTVTRPLRELRGFRRVSLRAGASATVRFDLVADDLAFHDLAMHRVVEPGRFTVFVGGDSDASAHAGFTFHTADGQSVGVRERCAADR